MISGSSKLVDYKDFRGLKSHDCTLTQAGRLTLRCDQKVASPSKSSGFAQVAVSEVYKPAS